MERCLRRSIGIRVKRTEKWELWHSHTGSILMCPPVLDLLRAFVRWFAWNWGHFCQYSLLVHTPYPWIWTIKLNPSTYGSRLYRPLISWFWKHGEISYLVIIQTRPYEYKHFRFCPPLNVNPMECSNVMQLKLCSYDFVVKPHEPRHT